MRITIKRHATLPDCTLGVMLIDGIPMFPTIERPWKGNEPYVSCIPQGTYELEWVDTQTAGNRNGRGLGIKKVPGRTLIRIHVANTAKDVQGCIGVGMQFYKFKKGYGVSGSRQAFRKLLDIMADKDDVTLSVYNA